jgi:excisionase family DNA binding protein
MKLDDYMTVTEAARFLGVHPETLRRWDWAGKVVPARHPVNNYRLYRRNELEALLRRTATTSAKQRRRQRR